MTRVTTSNLAFSPRLKEVETENPEIKKSIPIGYRDYSNNSGEEFMIAKIKERSYNLTVAPEFVPGEFDKRAYELDE